MPSEASVAVAPSDLRRDPPLLRWSNRYAALGAAFHTRLPARGLPEPHWIATSESTARLLGLPDDWAADDAHDPSALQVFSGKATWPGMDPIATVYSGHQFGVWAGQLGDGRALMLGEIETPGGATFEVQLKGSGPTPYSRMGDGRAVLRSSIREFLCSEAMAGLGIPTTRALALIGSPQPVRRETIETAAVVTRVAESFVRFGHFEHFGHGGQPEALRTLADHVIDRHLPACREAPQPYLALLAETTRRTAELMAAWQSVGFCHGVMNTDNLSILGLTIDYGPFGFLDGFDPGHICNHSDHQGRYAWARQPNVGFWNLHALAQALMPLIEDSDAALTTLETYKTIYAAAMLRRWSAKLGLAQSEPDDRALIDDWLQLLANERVDFTIAHRRLAGLRADPLAGSDPSARPVEPTFTTPDAPASRGAPETPRAREPVRDLFIDGAAFDAWAARYAARLARESSVDADRALRMDRVNPRYLLRNHLAENAIRAAEAGDFGEVRALQAALQRPFDDQDAATAARYAGFPPDWASTLEISCSS